MKIKRYKKVNRHLGFYINKFKFRQPYQLLIDGTFCYAALNNKINIADNMPRYLQGELKLLTTACSIVEMESLGPKLNGALIILKQFPLHKCGHEKKPISGASCILSMVGKNNPKHYLVATQDRDLQEKVRRKVGVPLIYLHDKAPVLDPPSKVSQNAAKLRLDDMLVPDKSKIEEMRKASGLVEDEKKPKKKKVKGPNPLSCKKKQKKATVTQNNPINKAKRKKIRIAKHVKETLLQ